MAKPLFRNQVLMPQGAKAGTDGNAYTELLFGTVDITCPSADASDIGVRTASISNLDGSAQIFLTAGSIQAGFALVSACVNANGGEFSASFLNATTANISSSAIATLQYLAVV